MRVPQHRCTLPAPLPAAHKFTCPVCGERYFAESRYSSADQSVDRRWSRFTPRRCDGTLRDAYELEQVAAALPRSSWWRRRRMLRDAAVARRLAGVGSG